MKVRYTNLWGYVCTGHCGALVMRGRYRSAACWKHAVVQLCYKALWDVLLIANYQPQSIDASELCINERFVF